MKKYRLSWRTFEGPIKAIINFYCEHQDVNLDEMSSASYSAWCACDTVINGLPPAERDIIMDRFTRTEAYSEDRPPLEVVNAVIRKTCRLVAETMGIADKDTK